MTAAAANDVIRRHRAAPAADYARFGEFGEFEERAAVEPLGSGWVTVTVVIGVMAALIAIGGMVLSFRAVSQEMVPAFGARWAWLVPVVVDLTVFVFSGVDLVLARLDMGHPLARWTVYGATGGTVYLNYSAGGTVPGRIAHVLMPAIWVVFIELMRHVVRRQVNLATASHREAIPAARWFLSPWPTLKLWRRMVLWRVNSYPLALDQEKQRLGAVATARELHGRFWRWRISPLLRLQINLGEIGAHHLHGAAAPAPPAPAPGKAPTALRYTPAPPAAPAEAGREPGSAPAPAPAPPEPAEPAPAPAESAHVPAPRSPLGGPARSEAPAIPSAPVAVPMAVPVLAAVPAPAPVPPAETPPPMPPVRRSLRESELLTAAREVERWRGQPSATRISRELGIGMALATSIANALREEDGPGV